MRVLIVSPVSIYPNTRGTTQRILGLSSALKALGNEIFIIHAGVPDVSKNVLGFASFERTFSSASSLCRFLDSHTDPLNPSLWHAVISAALRIRPDVIQFEFPSSCPLFLVSMLRKVSPASLIVLNEHNVQSDLVRSSATPYFFPYVEWLEKRAVCAVDLSLAVSEGDRTRILDKFGVLPEKVVVIPNGVDTRSFVNLGTDKARHELGIRDDELIALFHGSMSAKPNRQAARIILEKIAPRVRSINKNVKFIIAGEGTKALFNQSRAEANGVRLLGFVDHIEALIMAADICIVPLLSGGGTSLKIIEYLTAGKPIVTTKIGCRGLDLEAQSNLAVCDDVREFPEEILRLLEATKCGRMYAPNPRLGALVDHDWEVIGRRLDELYRGALARTTSR